MNTQESRSAKSFHAYTLPTPQESFVGRICQVIPTGKTYQCVLGSQGEDTLRESHSPSITSVTIDKDTFVSQVSGKGTYIFDCTVDPKHIIAVFEGISQRFDYYFEGVTDVYEAWRNNDGDVIYTSTSSPNENDPVYQGGGVVVGYVEEHKAKTTTWDFGASEVDLEDYGITIAGTPTDGSAIFVTYIPATQEPEWVEVKMTIGGTSDTLENHLTSLRNDIGDLGDTVTERLPAAPDEEGTYTLKCTVSVDAETSEVTKVYSWEA